MPTYKRMTYDLSKPLSTKARKALENEYPTGEWLVCDEDWATNLAHSQIRSSLWAFRPSFLSSETGLPELVFSCLQEKMSEDCNDAVKALITSTCGLESFIESAIQADGRGRFCSTYDGEEVEYKVNPTRILYLYRCN